MSSPQLIQNPLIPSTSSGSVDTTTRTNSFQIDLRGFRSSTASLSLTGLSGDANLEVFRGSGDTKTSLRMSRNQGKLSESIILPQEALAPDIYTVEVTLGEGSPNVDYKLNVAVNADADLSNIWWRSPSTAQAAVWQMNGTKIAGASIYDQIGAEWQVAGVADLNADGEDDVLWRNTSNGYVGYWLIKAGQLLSGDISFSSPIPLDWQISAVKDFSGDGQADIVWHNAQQGLIAVWALSGGKYQSGSMYAVGAGWKVSGTGDFDGDTRTDIVFQNSNSGDVVIWQMNGTAIDRPSDPFRTGTAWQPQFFGDINGDGQDDVVLRNRVSGTAAVWLMQGTRIATPVITEAISSEWQIAALGNFDGATAESTGNKDLLWYNSRTGDMSAWLFNAAGTGYVDRQLVSFKGQKYSKGANWSIAGVGDFNRDGKEDILYRNNVQGDVEVLLMNGTEIGAKDGVSGVGANWRVQGIMKREVRVDEPFEISGRTLTGGFAADTAFDMGVLDGRATYTDKVEPGFADYFKFNVSTRSNVSLAIAEQGVALELFQLLANGTLGNAIAISNEMLLNNGGYAVKVSATGNAVSTYRLNVFGQPQVTDVAGAGFTLTNSALELKASETNQTNSMAAKFKVKNNSSIAVSNLKVGFRISRDGQIDASTSSSNPDALLQVDSGTGLSTTFTLATPLAAGATSDWIDVTLRLPNTNERFWFVDGDYTIGLVVDPNNELTEDNEINNSNVALNTDKATLAISGTETVELIGTNMQVSGTFAPDQVLTVSFTLQNFGNRSYPSTLPIQFYLSSDTTLDTQADIPLRLRDAGTNDDFILNRAFIDPVGGIAIDRKNTPGAIKTVRLELQLPKTFPPSWVPGQTIYLTSLIASDDSLEVNPANNSINPETVDTADDTIRKNYVKFTLS
jgi:hypothetical protein